MDLHQHNKQKDNVTQKDNCEWCEHCNDQEINTGWLFLMPQQLADLKFFFHDLIVFMSKNKLQDMILKLIACIGDVGSTRKFMI